MPLQPGQVLNQRYRIVRLLGQGGFGAVYRAWDINLNRPCAVKENLDTSAEAQRQFTREATILANLSHPNLPRVTDHFILADQGQYLVMDYVEGDDLATIVKRQGQAALSTALDWIMQVADALVYLHSRQPPVVHRDVKPANIRITPEGSAMLVDFGLVKVFSPSMRTTLGARAVTPGYAPPEQYGQGNTDGRSDLYALGATLYNLLSAREPMESVQRMAGGQLTPLRSLNPQVPAGVEAAIEQAMRLEPGARYASVAEFRAALAGLAARPPAGAGPALVQPGSAPPLTPANRAPAAEPRPVPGYSPPPAHAPAAPPAQRAPIQATQVLPHSPYPAQERSHRSAPPPKAAARRPWLTWLTGGLLLLVCVVGGGLAAALVASSRQAAAQLTSDAQAQLTAASRQRTTSTAQAQASATAAVYARATEQAQSTRQALDSFVAQLEQIKILVYGPASGNLTHNAENGLIEAADAGVNLKNFIVQARFFNPYDTSLADWDYGFVLRHQKENVQYRFIVRSDNTWTLINNTGSPNGAILAEGRLDNLDTNPKGSNLLRLVFQDGRGIFFLNDRLVAELDLSRRLNPGNILATTGFFEGDEITKYATGYADFMIWSIP
ncbi:MAG: serine/threonine protein kinase [Chloroflexota bacterium]